MSEGHCQARVEPLLDTSRPPLSHPIFRALWAASLTSYLGAMIQSVGASWMMTSIDGSPQMVAAVQAALSLPLMLFALVAGAIADSVDRRLVMLGSQIFMLIVSLILFALAWFGLITPWLLLLLTFLLGCGTAMNAPAWQASVGDVVARDQVPAAVAINSMGFNIARSLGPALGGVIVATAGAATAFIVNAATYVPMIWVLGSWRRPRTAPDLPRETIGAAIAGGIRYILLSPTLGAVILRGFVFGFGAGAVPSLLPLIARDSLGGGAIIYGVLLGSFGLGAVVGGLALARMRAAWTPESMVRLACLASAAAAVLIGLSSAIVPTALLVMVVGGAWLMVISNFMVTVQLRSPRWFVARTVSIYQMAVFGGMASGALAWGWATAVLGIAIALSAAAAVQVFCALIGLRLPLPSSFDVDLTPLDRWRAPETAVPVEHRTGPIVIAVEYRIREADQAEFLAVLTELRRIRRREGVRNWALLRDLADAQVWIERFQTPTWLDYVRQSTRFTREDGLVHDRVRALHCGPGTPLVRRMAEEKMVAAADTGASEYLSSPSGAFPPEKRTT
jgi:MFS family permease